MSRYYRLKTARPLLNTFVPGKVTQPGSPTTSKEVDHCMIWREVEMTVPNEPSIGADRKDGCGEDYTIIEPMSPNETLVVEIDLEDPVTALQIVRRHAEIFPEVTNDQFLLKLNVLAGLAVDEWRARSERANNVYSLLLELDVPASPAKES